MHRPSSSPTASGLGSAVGHGPIGIHVGVRERRFHHGADAPRSPRLRVAASTASANGQRQLAGGDVPRTSVLRVQRRPTQSDAVGLGPIGIHVGVRERRFHHGADAPRLPRLRVAASVASANGQRQLAGGDVPRTSDPRVQRLATRSDAVGQQPRRPTRPDLAQHRLRRSTAPAFTVTHGTQFGLCRWTRAVWDPRGGLSVALPPWG